MPDQEIGPIDGESSEWRIFGPPGTGKTTYLARQISRAVDRFGPAGVLVTSFSRAAAAELAGRHLPIPANRVGTLHAHCFGALGNPKIAETQVDDWNKTYPRWEISGLVGSDERDEAHFETATNSSAGDVALGEINRLRGRMVSRTLWKAELQNFYHHWQDWKIENDLMDFTDLIQEALDSIAIAPGDPRVIACDEAQDLNRMQLALVRKWGRHCEYFLVVGDDDQTIYEFTGASPDAFLCPPVPPRQKIVLAQSFRVPAAVHALSSGWIHSVSKREPKEYRPRDFQGEVHRLHSHGLKKQYGWKTPDKILDLAEARLAAGQKVMFLGACAYHLWPLLKGLRERGIPFGNRYRRRRGDWNPLAVGHGTSGRDRLAAFLMPHEIHGPRARAWTAGEFVLWAGWCRVGEFLKRGAKTTAASLPPETLLDEHQLAQWIEPEPLDRLFTLLETASVGHAAQWWADQLLEAHKHKGQYLARVVARGIERLDEEPKVCVGTIHSVKGGESDVVFLFPDLSAPGYLEWMKRNECRDSVVRQFYVGMTRAREALVVCEAESQMAVAP